MQLLISKFDTTDSEFMANCKSEKNRSYRDNRGEKAGHD